MDSSFLENYSPVVQWGVVIGASLAAALWDLRVRRIPNLLTYPLLGAGLLWQAWFGGMLGFVDGVIGCALMALPFVLLFLYAGGGAGDAKMMGALGAWLGVVQGLVVLVAVVCAGALLGLGLALTKKRFSQVLGHMKPIAVGWVGRFIALGWRGGTPPKLPREAELTEMPYALSIFCGVCMAAFGAVLWHV